MKISTEMVGKGKKKGLCLPSRLNDLVQGGVTARVNFYICVDSVMLLDSKIMEQVRYKALDPLLPYLAHLQVISKHF